MGAVTNVWELFKCARHRMKLFFFLQVEFAPPVGYKEPQEAKEEEEAMAVDPADLMPEPTGFVAFRGAGNRLDGKKRKDWATTDVSTPKPVYVRGIPDYDYQIGESFNLVLRFQYLASF